MLTTDANCMQMWVEAVSDVGKRYSMNMYVDNQCNKFVSVFGEVRTKGRRAHDGLAAL